MMQQSNPKNVSKKTKILLYFDFSFSFKKNEKNKLYLGTQKWFGDKFILKTEFLSTFVMVLFCYKVLFESPARINI